jgi:arylsulfatase A-like enzyme
LPLLQDQGARQSWPNKELIQISEAIVGRAIRTADWVYCVADSGANPRTDKSSTKYQEYLFYDERGDPNELVNLAARKEYRQHAADLREELKRLIVAAGEPEPEILPAKFYP